LLEYETLSGDEIAGLLKGELPHRPDDDNKPQTGGPSSPFPTTGSAGVGGAEPQGT
jgi:cell division protease FtsH